MIITVRIETQPARGSLGRVEAADHAEIMIGRVRRAIENTPDTKIIGVEWEEYPK